MDHVSTQLSAKLGPVGEQQWVGLQNGPCQYTAQCKTWASGRAAVGGAAEWTMSVHSSVQNLGQWESSSGWGCRMDHVSTQLSAKLGSVGEQQWVELHHGPCEYTAQCKTWVSGRAAVGGAAPWTM